MANGVCAGSGDQVPVRLMMTAAAVAAEIKDDMSEGCRKHLPGLLYVISLYRSFNA